MSSGIGKVFGIIRVDRVGEEVCRDAALDKFLFCERSRLRDGIIGGEHTEGVGVVGAVFEWDAAFQSSFGEGFRGERLAGDLCAEVFEAFIGLRAGEFIIGDYHVEMRSAEAIEACIRVDSVGFERVGECHIAVEQMICLCDARFGGEVFGFLDGKSVFLSESALFA